MMTTGIILLIAGVALFALSTFGAIRHHSNKGAAAAASGGGGSSPFEVVKWVFAEIKTLGLDLVKPGLEWFERTIRLGLICAVVGLVLMILA